LKEIIAALPPERRERVEARYQELRRIEEGAEQNVTARADECGGEKSRVGRASPAVPVS
jgi:hypothetical protein